MAGPTGPAGPENFSTCQIPHDPRCNDQEQCYGYPLTDTGGCCYIAGECQNPRDNHCILNVEPTEPNLFPPPDGLLVALHDYEIDYPIDGCYCATTALLPNDNSTVFYPNPNNESCTLNSVEEGITDHACWGSLQCDYSNDALGANVTCKTQNKCQVRTYSQTGESLRSSAQCNRLWLPRPNLHIPTFVQP